MSKLFFTSDTHFGHQNIIKFCDRPFADAREMNEVMIERWNEKVRPRDIVYHLGDFAFKHPGSLPLILDRLNGKICLIAGNHEKEARQHPKRFEWIKDYFELKVNDPDAKHGVRRIMLFHYAMRTWRGAGRGNWHLYGHSHGTLPDLEDQLSFDVGVDCHDFYPISYDEVKAIMSQKKWKSPF